MATTTIETEEAADEGRPLVNVRAVARGTDLSFTNALVGGAIGDQVAVSRGLVQFGYGGKSLKVHQGGAGVIATAGETTIQQGGARSVLSAGSVTMTQAGSGFAVGRSIRVERQGLVIFGLAPRLEVQDGGRVIFGPKAALALLGGIAALGALVSVAMALGRSPEKPAQGRKPAKK
jgi:hypothetical protein